mmetsp:Transcript_14646/g.21094  ORF Transcript_14646/g.21094 Transcript_14646/m.21094 type:complete len:218 (+) Transcript_14646:92-745(+)
MKPRMTTSLSMGLLDSISSMFLQEREGDFIKLEDSDEAFGPGPLLVLYRVPAGIDDGEIRDMLEDGAPKASKKGVTLYRIDQQEERDPLLLMKKEGDGKSVQEALAQIMDGSVVSVTPEVPSGSSVNLPNSSSAGGNGCPVLFFSGFENSEMMESYNILGNEIYMETGGACSPACAKCVPNAMEKPLRQVLEEISGDHLSAIQEEKVKEEEEKSGQQ